MKATSRTVLIFFMLLGVSPSPVYSESLDSFETGKFFPTDFVFKEDIPSLKHLSLKDIDPVLQKFMDARDHVESPGQDNLIHLGVSYLYLRQENYQKTFETLNQIEYENFLLQDFRTYFLTVALQALAEESIREEDFDQAIGYLKEAFNNQIILFEKYPSSPFHEDVPKITAQIESRLGDVYFMEDDYPAAISSYNNALARKISNCDCDGAQLKIYSALAKTYEAGSELSEAADIHIYLLNHHSSRQTQTSASTFFEKNHEELEQMNGSVRILEELLDSKREEQRSPIKSVARKPAKWPKTNNEIFSNLFHALSKDDFSAIVEHGEKVLKKFPGDENTRGIFNHMNKAITKNVSSPQWREGMNRLVNLYPVRQTNKLASRLWESGFPDAAQLVYQKVLDNYPNEVQSCHKALYFMGRIEEDHRRYPEAINYYQRLLDKYNWGYFTSSAQFKIPWLHRLEGHLEEAKAGFNEFLKYINPERFRNPDNGFQEPDDFRPAALFWLAETERQLENNESKVLMLKQLVDKFPMDFYAMVARIEMSMQPLDFLEPGSVQKSVSRKWGMGEINRMRINRAEQLISIGFLEMGMKELSQITEGENNQEFLYYLAKLFKRAGGYQRAIRLSWGISRKNHHDSISPSLAEVLFPKPYVEEAIQESSQYNLSPYLVLALMRQESAFNKKVVSSARAVGLMQLLPSTAKRVARSMKTKTPDPDDLKKPEVNIQLGVKYLSGLLSDFEDNIIFALASYNAGPGKVKQWMETRSHLKSLEFMESIPYKETRNYVKKVLRNYVIYKTLYGEGGIHDFQSILTVRNN